MISHEYTAIDTSHLCLELLKHLSDDEPDEDKAFFG